MMPRPSQSDQNHRRELLLELFINACALAMLKQMVLAPVSNASRPIVPDYYRG